MIASKKIASNINKWNQVQEVLHTDAAEQPQVKPQPIPTVVPTPAKAVSIAVKQKSASVEPPSAPEGEDEFEYSDPNALMCLLCSRQLKSLDQLKRHNKESELHKVFALVLPI